MAGRLWRLKSTEVTFTIALVFALGLGIGAEYFGLHFAIGAFLAGLFIEETAFGTKAFDNIQAMVSGLTLGFLCPIFFASAGLHFDFVAIGPAWRFTILVVLAASPIALRWLLSEAPPK